MKSCGKRVKNIIFNYNFVISFLLSTSINVVSLNTSYGASLPRNPRPTPTLPHQQPIKPSPKVKIGTRPAFNPSNIGALPDLIVMRGVRTTINPRVLNMCRAGKKPNANSSIPVLNFSFRVKNIGKGTAYMNRDGVIVSAQATDFHEPVFSMNKYYLGGKGGPGHFINAQGNRQNWILKKLAHIKPGQIINATSHLGISYNNRTFTLNRLQELAGQTHKFLLKLTSYGNPGLKESNTRNNKVFVSYTFPRDFCKSSLHGGVSASAPVLKPHLILKKMTLRLKRPYECRTDSVYFAEGDLFIQNTGDDFIPSGRGKLYNIVGHPRGVQTSLRTVGFINRKIKKGQTERFHFGSVASTAILHQPTPPMSELAGKTVNFRISWLGTPSIPGNGSKKLHFPANFCK